MKFDDDSAIEENRFMELVNEASPKEMEPFSKDEINRHLETLSEQGKVMKSDGVIYIIDWLVVLATFSLWFICKQYLILNVLIQYY